MKTTFVIRKRSVFSLEEKGPYIGAGDIDWRVGGLYRHHKSRDSTYALCLKEGIQMMNPYRPVLPVRAPFIRHAVERK